MQKILVSFVFSALVISCRQGKKGDTKNITAPAKRITWVDSLVMKYISQTDDDLVKLAVKDTIPEEWSLDRMETTDTANCFVFQIGHSFEHRFVTDKWVYIDSLTRNIFEYDLANDSLIRWPK